MIEKRFNLLKKIIEQCDIKIDIENGHVYKKVYGRTKRIGTEATNGYRIIGGLKYNGKYYTFKEHQIIAVAMGLNLIDKDVNHINGIRNDNRACNLEAITHLENNRLKTYKCKLNDDELQQLIQLRKNGMTWFDLCLKFKLAESTMRRYIRKFT